MKALHMYLDKVIDQAQRAIGPHKISIIHPGQLG
jgi:hypothetical protein